MCENMQVTVGMQKYYLRCYFSKELYSLLAWNKLAPALDYLFRVSVPQWWVRTAHARCYSGERDGLVTERVSEAVCGVPCEESVKSWSCVCSVHVRRHEGEGTCCFHRWTSVSLIFRRWCRNYDFLIQKGERLWNHLCFCCLTIKLNSIFSTNECSRYSLWNATSGDGIVMQQFKLKLSLVGYQKTLPQRPQEKAIIFHQFYLLYEALGRNNVGIMEEYDFWMQIYDK